MADTTALAKGITIKKDGKFWFVNDAFFVSPGKGAAFYRTKLKAVGSGKVVEHTFKSGESIETVEIERRNASYLYREGERFVFMDDENYEQYALTEDQLDGNMKLFLKEQQTVTLLFAESEIIQAQFQKAKMAFEVIEAPPGIKGDTATNTTRLVKLETGVEIHAPLFIKEGESIIVNVDTMEYCERAK